MTSPKNKPEDFLQYIWENRLFFARHLISTANEHIEIIKPGKRNFDSGPDFFNAKIKLDNTIWAGNVEIHKKASDWNKHQHQNDKSYDNVILHVVETADVQIYRENQNAIPTLVLQYPEHLLCNYQNLLNSKTWIACQSQFRKIDPIILQLGYNRLMIERLEQKTESITESLNRINNNWNETFYQMLARMFGFKVNAVPFELLAKSLPINILAKHKNSLFQLEALLFGNSGLLNHQLLGDDYYLKLREEYAFLYKKYNLRAIETHLWKFMRLRPMNFPTVRISQFASLLYKNENLFSKILEIADIVSLKKLFRINASSYWDTHYNFNKQSNETGPKELGESSANLLIINVIIPFLFVFGEKQNKPQLKNRALDFLEELPAESNSTIKKWKKLGVKPQSAFESQALLQLKNSYCEEKKCLNCRIGVKLVSTPEKPEN
jgi:hypothetical protein